MVNGRGEGIRMLMRKMSRSSRRRRGCMCMWVVSAIDESS